MLTVELVITFVIIEKIFISVIIYRCYKKEHSETPQTKLKNVKNITYRDCPICFEEFNEEDNISILECDHYYHTECIKKWINTPQLDKYNRKITKNCPLCREPLVIISNKQTD